jgi:hypothetical protein
MIRCNSNMMLLRTQILSFIVSGMGVQAMQSILVTIGGWGLSFVWHSSWLERFT